MTNSINITAKENDLMNAMIYSDFMENEITDWIWAWSAYCNVTMDKASVSGVVSSLIKKGLVILDDEESNPDDHCLRFTDKGADLVLRQAEHDDSRDNEYFNPKKLGFGEPVEIAPVKKVVKTSAAVAAPTREGACLTAWNTFNAHPGATRKEQIAAAMKAGVAAGTSSTQFARWKRFIIAEPVIVQGQKAYVAASSAKRAGLKTHGDNFVGTHELPSGRFCFEFKV